METKVCAKCGRELPIQEFYQNKKYSDGYFCYCKECHKALVTERRQRMKGTLKAETEPETLPISRNELHPTKEESPFMPTSCEPKLYSKFLPTLTDAEIKELEQHGLINIAGRLLLNALRYKGYRGAVELVTVQKVVI